MRGGGLNIFSALSEVLMRLGVFLSVRPRRRAQAMPGRRGVGGGVSLRVQFACGMAAAWLLLALPSAVQAANVKEYLFDIPKQPVASALDRLATQADLLLLFPYDEARS